MEELLVREEEPKAELKDEAEAAKE